MNFCFEGEKCIWMPGIVEGAIASLKTLSMRRESLARSWGG